MRLLCGALDECAVRLLCGALDECAVRLLCGALDECAVRLLCGALDECAVRLLGGVLLAPFSFNAQFECVDSTIQLEQSLPDRSKVKFEPVV